MGIYINAILHEIGQYEKNLGRKAKYLLLSPDKEVLLVHECYESGSMIKQEYDGPSGRKFKSFAGLEVVKVGISFQGSFGWALGE